jgi:hypothetical protein
MRREETGSNGEETSSEEKNTEKRSGGREDSRRAENGGEQERSEGGGDFKHASLQQAYPTYLAWPQVTDVRVRILVWYEYLRQDEGSSMRGMHVGDC